MGLATYAGQNEDAQRAWSRGLAQDCGEVALALIAIGLLYWAMMLAYAVSLPSGWFASIHMHGGNPLGITKDPFWLVFWLLYWAIAIGLWRRAGA